MLNCFVWDFSFFMLVSRQPLGGSKTLKQLQRAALLLSADTTGCGRENKATVEGGVEQASTLLPLNLFVGRRHQNDCRIESDFTCTRIMIDKYKELEC